MLGREHVQRPGPIQQDSEELQLRNAPPAWPDGPPSYWETPSPSASAAKTYYIGGEEINDIANELLGIHNDAHYDLFAGDNYDSKPEAVARTLRHLADTGTVVWQFPDDFPEGMTRERGER